MPVKKLRFTNLARESVLETSCFPQYFFCSLLTSTDNFDFFRIDPDDKIVGCSFHKLCVGML